MSEIAASLTPGHCALLGRKTALDAMFAPKTVALIGATGRPGTVGRTILENLLANDFGGTVYPVNPRHKTVLGRETFARIGEVPAAVDLAVIVTPAATVPGVIRECADAGVRGAVIISAGFGETGGSGRELERQVAALARQSRMRVVGPNCLGVMLPHAGLNATFAAGMALPGSVGFISQSGALCTAVLDWSLRENVGFSAFVSAGAMADVGWGDLIYWLGDDPHTRSIVIYMESIGGARAFLSAAREVALTKPIIVLKVGRTGEAARAAASHTGALTGSDDVLDAAFRRVGVLRVDTIEELFDMAEVLAKQPRPAGPRLAIVTNAGGPGALATDHLVLNGGEIAELSPASLDALNLMLPAHWSHANPVDILGDADAARYAGAVEIVLRDPQNDGVLVILTPQAMTECETTAANLSRVARTAKKPVLASWMGGRNVAAGESVLNAAGIPTFAFPDTAARAFAAMWRYGRNLDALYETPALLAHTEPRSHARAAKLIAARRGFGLKGKRAACVPPSAPQCILSEFESKKLLASYGIPTVPTHVAKSEREAVAIASRLGERVVLKLHSRTITHKAEVGGVKLNLRGSAEVRRAWREIAKSVSAEDFLGATVQPMVGRDGCELILGASVDPQFGPVLLFGAGGRLVEVLKDRALGLPPLNATLARRLIEQTRIFSALHGARGRPAADLAALESVLVNFSQLVAEQRGIREIEINPLLVSGKEIVALDARVILHAADVREEMLPPLAIRPYPAQYVSRCRLSDGARVIIRPIRPEDEPQMIAFHRALSERTVHFRYFGDPRFDARVAHERLRRICFNDYDREIALVAEHMRRGASEIVGVARLSKLHGSDDAEFAVVIADAWQGRGLGTRMMCELLRAGRAERLSRIRGRLLADNVAMQRICGRLGFKMHADEKAGEVAVEVVP